MSEPVLSIACLSNSLDFNCKISSFTLTELATLERVIRAVVGVFDAVLIITTSERLYTKGDLLYW